MAKRTICIKTPSKLSISSNNLAITQSERKVLIPLEDIWIVIIETHQAQITSAALSALADNTIIVVQCGRNHTPNALLIPMEAHYRQTEIINKQLSIPKPLAKRLWQKIIKAKITNQSIVLDLLGLNGSDLVLLAKNVLSGDKNNREATAASLYFKNLIPIGGRRNSEYTPALDYGYSVLRAGIARSTVAGGWLPSIGICHSSRTNPFNLVDDLIEPFRPIIDLLVVKENMIGCLTPNIKTKLASIFEYEVLLPTGKTTVQTAIEVELSTFKASVFKENVNLLHLPTIIPLNRKENNENNEIISHV